MASAMVFARPIDTFRSVTAPCALMRPPIIASSAIPITTFDDARENLVHVHLPSSPPILHIQPLESPVPQRGASLIPTSAPRKRYWGAISQASRARASALQKEPVVRADDRL